MTIQINNVEMPESMRNRALNYLYLPGTQVARNGLGEIILAGGGIVTWTWSQLNQEEFAWWVTTVLGGEPSKEISGTPGIIVLYDDIHQERAFGHGIVLAPQYKGYSGVFYNQVTVQIDALY